MYFFLLNFIGVQMSEVTNITALTPFKNQIKKCLRDILNLLACALNSNNTKIPRPFFRCHNVYDHAVFVRTQPKPMQCIVIMHLTVYIIGIKQTTIE